MGCIANYIGKEKHDMEQEDNDYLTYKAQGRYALGWSEPNTALSSALAQQQAYNNALAQSMAQTKHAVSASILNQAFAQQAPATKPLGHYHLENDADWTFDELNDEGSVYNMSLQNAIDLAINKFGSRWFKDIETIPALEENKDFWLKVMAKLFKAGNLQKEVVRNFELDQVTTAWKIVDTDHAN